jgi:amino acid transporter
MGGAGTAPHFLAKTTKHGIPIYSVIVCHLLGLLAMMQVSSAAADVLHYFIDLCTVCEMIVYATARITYSTSIRPARSRDYLAMAYRTKRNSSRTPRTSALS